MAGKQNRTMRDAYQRQLLVVREILNRHDPMGLVEIGCPDDEYDPEIAGVLRAVKEATDRNNFERRITEVFANQFDQASAHSFVGWGVLADELWTVSRKPEW